LAAIVQVPEASVATVALVTLHTEGVSVLKVTASPEVAVALATVVLPGLSVAGVKVMAPMDWDWHAEVAKT